MCACVLDVCVQKLTGSADGLLAAQRSPSTPLQRLAAHHKEVAELVRSEQGPAGQSRAGKEHQGRCWGLSHTAVTLRHLALDSITGGKVALTAK